MEKIFKIKRALAVPLALDAVLCLILLLITIFTKGSSLEIWILSIGLLPLVFVSLELFNREVGTDDSGLKIKKTLRTKELFWSDITHVGVLAVKKKIYLVLTTTKGFHVVSNAYDNFSGLIREVMNRVEKDKIEDNVAELVEHPINRVSDIVLSWVAAVVIAGIIFIKLLG